MIYRDSLKQSMSPFPSAFSSYVPRSRKVFGCICISPNNRILVVKGQLSGKWSLPKGHIEGNENDIQCALRELQEETGIVPNVKYSDYKKLAAGGYFIFSFDSEPTPHVTRTDEISDAKWCDLQEIKSLQCNLDLNNFTRWMKKNSHTFMNKKVNQQILLEDPICPVNTD